MDMNTQPQTEYVKAISEIAAAAPLARTVQLYEFAMFLQAHPRPAEETLEAIAADEALWDAQFAATSDDKLARLVASVQEEIKTGKTRPMFDEHGELSDTEFEALADLLAEEFTASIKPNTPPLSNYTVSRAGIYEDHP